MGRSATQIYPKTLDLTRSWLSHRWPDVLAATVWTVFAAFRIMAVIRQPSLMQIGLLVYNLIIVSLFIRRRPASIRGSPMEFLLAVVATFLPMLLNGSHPSGLEAIGMVLQNTGILFMFVSILTLNRSFGLAPAHRGLVTHGAYRFVRHPLYASQLVSLAGYCLGYPTAWNLATWSVIAFAQVLRIRAEERLLASDPEYRDYMVSVPTRLVPGLW